MSADNDRPIWDRMRDAAAVLSEVSSVLHPNEAVGWCLTNWSSSELHALANKWEREAEETAARDQVIDDVAAAIYHRSSWNGITGSRWDQLPANAYARTRYRPIAEALLRQFDIRPVQVPF